MQVLRDLIKSGEKLIQKAAEVTLKTAGEYVILRRQMINKHNYQAQSPLGEARNELYWTTRDFIVPVMIQKQDNRGFWHVYGQFEVNPGDLILRLRGAPQSEAAARGREVVGVLRVVEVPDVRRSGSGRIIQSHMLCARDTSGQWNMTAQSINPY
ncbi:MAG: hypothetical protein D6800_03240 [Candidatus Zixiibacteriota bacterium]|nr:MAG: hypothetical protein D6800_03240 [candidate division Zixibacteria bacterium]